MNRRTAAVLDDDPLMTPPEVAALFRVDVHTVTNWAREGLLTSQKTPGGHIRFRRSTIAALFEAEQ